MWVTTLGTSEHLEAPPVPRIVFTRWEIRSPAHHCSHDRGRCFQTKVVTEKEPGGALAVPWPSGWPRSLEAFLLSLCLSLTTAEPKVTFGVLETKLFCLCAAGPGCDEHEISPAQLCASVCCGAGLHCHPLPGAPWSPRGCVHQGCPGAAPSSVGRRERSCSEQWCHIPAPVMDKVPPWEPCPAASPEPCPLRAPCPGGHLLGMSLLGCPSSVLGTSTAWAPPGPLCCWGTAPNPHRVLLHLSPPNPGLMSPCPRGSSPLPGSTTSVLQLPCLPSLLLAG